MSKFLSKKYEKLRPYTPGEQPQDKKYVKLNTNESPYPPSTLGMMLALREERKSRLYPDPDVKELSDALASTYGVKRENVIATNGSDEVLNFAFMAWCDKDTPAVFADITYGFYKVFAEINSVPSVIIPLREDLTLNIDDYINTRGTVFIANPNAPTGIALPVSEIERLVESNRDRIVVVDEAYVDFGAESCVPLTAKYDNLLVTGTFSKSRSMAGARLGFGIGCKELISDLVSIKYSTNPYNVNRVTAAMGIGALKDRKYFEKNCKKIIDARKFTEDSLSELGFEFTDSLANFIFAKSSRIGGEELYLRLKEKGVLIRHFNAPRIAEYNRITIGSMEEMQTLVDKIKEILEEKE